MKIEKRLIKDLKPSEYNPRQATKEQEKHLQESLKKFGLVETLVVNSHEDRNNIIVGGHFRLRELKKLGHKEVDCVIVDLPLEDEKELNIRLNANSGGWDMDLLTNNFEVIDLEDWGLDLDWGLDEKEPDIVEDEVPELKKESIVKKGDVWLLGRHRLSCLDSIVVTDLEKLMDGEKADMAFVDPPCMKANSGSTRLSHMFDDDFTDEEEVEDE